MWWDARFRLFCESNPSLQRGPKKCVHLTLTSSYHPSIAYHARASFQPLISPPEQIYNTIETYLDIEELDIDNDLRQPDPKRRHNG
jgi:hypothetical protein